MTAKKTLALLALCFCLAFSSALAADAPSDKAEKAPAENPRVAIDTEIGKIVVELWPEVAPKTVANFLQYVDEGFYDGTIFHRVMKGFMIQGGGFTPDMKKKSTRKPIALEAKASNARYTIAMARTRNPNSATAQFFINLVNNTPLDDRPGRPGYAVFGKVVEGSGVVEQIARQPVKPGPGGERSTPMAPVIIEKASRVTD